MAVFVLVHPAWLGGWCWKKLIPLLTEHGHSVHPPTLTGLGERSHLVHPGVVMQTHVDDVVNVLIYEDLREVILVGTSSSGAVITGAADRVPERISRLVYVDAFVPEDGQAVWDLIPPPRRPPMEALVETEGFGWPLAKIPAGGSWNWTATTCPTSQILTSSRRCCLRPLPGSRAPANEPA